MYIAKISIPRRTFLRGVGVTLALPFLDAMVPALSPLAKAASRPPRLGFVYVPNGVNWMNWTPAGKGEAFEFSPTLAPLESFRKQLNVISQLSSIPAEAQGEGAGDHSRASGSWLSGTHVKKTEGSDARAGKTADQFAADALGADTQFPSLQLAVDRIGGLAGCEGGYACAYMNTLSWRTPTTPLPMQINPRVVFERLLGGDAGSPEERRAIAQAQGSILDSITQETRRLQNRLGGGDRARVDEYLEGIRELETRITKLEQQGDVDLLGAGVPVGIPDAFDDHVKLMFDLQVLAYRGDLTRVIAFLMSREATLRTYPQIGIPDPHHGLSHHGNDPVKLDKQAKIDKHHVTLLAYFLQKLQDTKDGDGTLLDNSLIMYGCGISNGQTHSHRNLPTLLIGSLGGRVKGGRHIVCPEDTPLTNLELNVLEKINVPVGSFGDSTGSLAEL